MGTLAAGLSLAAPVFAQTSTVYRCPGSPVLYTDSLSAKQAKEKGCHALESAPVSVIQGPRTRPPSGTSGTSGSANGPATTSPPGSRIDPADQRARDSDARRILESELRREEDRLAAAQTEYNNGQPERRGDEKNYQKYIDRVAELKADIARKESDIAALKRELAKMPQ